MNMVAKRSNAAKKKAAPKVEVVGGGGGRGKGGAQVVLWEEGNKGVKASNGDGHAAKKGNNLSPSKSSAALGFLPSPPRANQAGAGGGDFPAGGGKSPRLSHSRFSASERGREPLDPMITKLDEQLQEIMAKASKPQGSVMSVKGPTIAELRELSSRARDVGVIAREKQAVLLLKIKSEGTVGASIGFKKAKRISAQRD